MSNQRYTPELKDEIVGKKGWPLQEARIRRTEHLANSIPNSYIPYQYSNPFNPEAHIESTTKEIVTDFPNRLDAISIAVSTAGQVSGVSQGL